MTNFLITCATFALFTAFAPSIRAADADEYFDYTGQVVLLPSFEQSPFAIVSSGEIIVLADDHTNRTETLRMGDHIRVRGRHVWRDTSTTRKYVRQERCAFVKDLQILSHGTLPPAERLAIAAFNARDLRNHRISLKGTVSGIFRDDIDENFAFLTLNDDTDLAYVAFALSTNVCKSLHVLLGAEVVVTGLASGFFDSGRIHARQNLRVSRLDDFTVLRTPSENSFAAAPFETLLSQTPRETSESSAVRVKARVLGTWHGDRMIVLTTSNDVITVETADAGVPRPLDSVEIVGYPETDLFTIDLTRASWRSCEPIACDLHSPRHTSLKDLYWDSRQGKLLIRPGVHGETIAVKGIVKSFLTDERGNRRLLVADGSDSIVVDCSSLADDLGQVVEGCLIEATGVCVRESEYWRPHNPFPRHKGLFLVPRSPDDIVILSRPPWWTPVRLLVVIGSLFALLIAIGVWNILLRRLVARKGRELANGEIDRIESELKVFERTRLAVELHDSVAQSLTGVSMEIRAAQRARAESPDGLERHLNLAAQTLNSCRDELRNCLWDLRNLTTDETSIDDLLRRALRPHLSSARLSVRFNVPRERFTENTLHALVRIIRELAVNAVRHGTATEIRIAGCIENGNLLFSVTDNGSGFDPNHVPGMEEGHFGLQGIRDRIALFNGEMSLTSKAGVGTKASISIILPQETSSKT